MRAMSEISLGDLLVGRQRKHGYTTADTSEAARMLLRSRRLR
jgi:hypothetical protein